mmetsp:Transcript_3169/g.7430  ORF Transcript_3169/g.7430 Transcript_3169/m.7430 type:complete len:97 (+) Transcript_3169:4025-4315(+)
MAPDSGWTTGNSRRGEGVAGVEARRSPEPGTREEGGQQTWTSIGSTDRLDRWIPLFPGAAIVFPEVPQRMGLDEAAKIKQAAPQRRNSAGRVHYNP